MFEPSEVVNFDWGDGRELMTDNRNPDSAVIVTDLGTLERLIDRAVRRALDAHGPGRASDLRLLTPAEAGDRLGVSSRTVLKWARSEGMPHRELGPKVIRFVESEIVEWGARRDGEREAG